MAGKRLSNAQSAIVMPTPSRVSDFRVSKLLPYIYGTCCLPSSLPVCETPSVAAREMVFETSDDTIPASDMPDDFSPPPSPSISNLPPPPLAASSPICHDHGHLASSQPPPLSPNAHSFPDHGCLASRLAPPPSAAATAPLLPFSLDEIFSVRIPDTATKGTGQQGDRARSTWANKRAHIVAITQEERTISTP